MIESSRRLGLLEKATQRVGIVRQRVGENFQCDGAKEERVDRGIHNAHTPLAKPCRDAVLAQLGSDAGVGALGACGVGHRTKL
jgi:hypothetical protein